MTYTTTQRPIPMPPMFGSDAQREQWRRARRAMEEERGERFVVAPMCTISAPRGIVREGESISLDDLVNFTGDLSGTWGGYPVLAPSAALQKAIAHGVIIDRASHEPLPAAAVEAAPVRLQSRRMAGQPIDTVTAPLAGYDDDPPPQAA